MTFVYATVLLLAAAPFVLWPLVRRAEPRREAEPAPDPRIAIEEEELDSA